MVLPGLLYVLLYTPQDPSALVTIIIIKYQIFPILKKTDLVLLFVFSTEMDTLLFCVCRIIA